MNKGEVGVGIREGIGRRKAGKKKVRRLVSSRPAWVTEQNLATCPWNKEKCEEGVENQQERRKLDVVVYGSNFSTWKVKTGEFLWVHSHSELHSKFQVILGYGLRPCYLFLQRRVREEEAGKRERDHWRLPKAQEQWVGRKFSSVCGVDRVCMVPTVYGADRSMEAKQAGQQGLPKLLQHLHDFLGFAVKGFLHPDCLSPQHLRSRWSQTPECQGSWSLLISRLYGTLEAPWLSLLASELLMFSGLMSVHVNL